MPTRTKSKDSGGVPPAGTDPNEITTAQIHVPLLEKVRVIRQRRRLTIPEVLDLVAGPAVEEEYRKVVREMAAEFSDC